MSTQTIVGLWEIPAGQEYAGLRFRYNPDGTFEADYPPMGIKSSGTWTLTGNELDMNQTQHTLGWVGLFRALVDISEDGQTMKVAVAAGPNLPRPTDFTKYRLYKRLE
ncbi:MAG: hypothetical protein Kow00123_09830 [Anaerolineales bacterium]